MKEELIRKVREFIRKCSGKKEENKPEIKKEDTIEAGVVLIDKSKF